MAIVGFITSIKIEKRINMSKKELDLRDAVVETKQCKGCGEYKTRILDGKFNGKDKRWRDINNLLWNGLRCPQCHKKKMAKSISDKRSKEKSES